MWPAWSALFGLAFGAVVGSFLNVLIYRLPRRLSIAFPPSHCPHCQHQLGVPDLIPMISFLIQCARCRHCRAPIPWRYFWVELWNASLWTYLWWQFLIQDYSPLSFLAYALACSMLIAIFFIDLQHYIIPDELNAILLGIGMLHAVFAPGAPNGWEWASLGSVSWQNALIGAQSSALLFCLIALLGRLLFRKDAMGHGDIKMVRGLGALLMLPAAFVGYGLAIAYGAVIGIAWVMIRARRAKRQEMGSEDEEEPPYQPEPVGSLLTMCLFYLLWLDVALLFFPRKVQERVYTALGQVDSDLPEDALTEEETEPGMLPFGPFLVLGAMTVLIFSAPFVDLVRGYLEYAGF